jgi:hypothetical protein
VSPTDISPELRSLLEAVQTDRLRAVALSREPSFVEQLRAALRDVTTRRTTLFVLLLLDPTFSRDTAADLIRIGESDRDAVLVRQVLARLPRSDLYDVVRPMVERAAETGDGHVLLRMSELLWHLGLTESLDAVLAQARESGDPERVDVADTFT